LPDFGWTDFTARFRVKLISGGLNVNVRIVDDGSGPSRNNVGFRGTEA